jgi:spore coat polysaccharide biosynthesis protein SpsF
MERRLVAAIACRNQGSRLYGKPLQNLDVESGTRILDNIIDCLRTISCIDDIVLGISVGIENEVFKHIAEQKGIRYVLGDEHDVLSRLVQCGQLAKATDIFRVTSESPFLYTEPIEDLWKKHVDKNLDATFLDEIIDGTGFEIISLSALEVSHNNGDARHRSEHCSLYIRENKSRFKIAKEICPDTLNRKDLRLTVDNPEDLTVCRILYGQFKSSAPRFSIHEMVKYLDEHQPLKDLIAPFTEIGYSTMNR